MLRFGTVGRTGLTVNQATNETDWASEMTHTHPIGSNSRLLSRIAVSAGLILTFITFLAAQTPPRPAAQNPSPMVEYTRKHARIPMEERAGVRLTIATLFPKPVEVFIPERSRTAQEFDLLIHFHGAAFVVQHAAAQYEGNLLTAVVNLGAGSKVYQDPFADTLLFAVLKDSVLRQAGQRLGNSVRVNRLILSGFSAGYGAIRRIISTQNNYRLVDGILLLDGLHASYLPEWTPLADGGRIDSSGLLPFLRFAEHASQTGSRKQFLITHSEIFPGTFVSTTEASDWILQQLGLSREPVLAWGPLGMQQISRAGRHHFAVFGFAGNTAPDHVDHVHALYWFLGQLLKL